MSETHPRDHASPNRAARWLTAAAAVALSTLGTAHAAGDAGDEEGGPEILDVTAPAGKAPRPDLRIRVPEFSLETQQFTFPTGLRVMFQRDTTEPIIAVTSVTDHGASDDPIGKEGIAHLVEHLWFRSEHGDLPKTWDLLEAEMGCDLNAFTQYDITVYMTVCAGHNLEAMMKLESLRMTDTVRAVTEDMVTTEIEVVRNEIRMRSENYNMPFFTYWEQIGGHLYPEGHPYHRPMAGDHNTIRNCRLADVQQFTENYYTPDNTTTMVVGDLESDNPAYYLHLLVTTFDLSLLHPDLTEEHLRRQPKEGVTAPDPNNPDDWWLIPMNPDNPEEVLPYLVDMPVRADTFADLLPPEPVTQEIGVSEGPVDEPTVVVAWTMPPGYQGDDTLLQITGGVTNFVVSQGIEATEDPNLKDFFGCGAIPSKRNTLAICVAKVRGDDKKDAERVARKIIDQIPSLYGADENSGVVQQDQQGRGSVNYRALLDFWFSRMRMQFLADTLTSLDLYASVGAGRATDISQYAHFTGNPRYHSAMMTEAMKLQSYQVSELASRWLTRERAAKLLILPADRDEVALLSEDTEGSGGHFRGGGEGRILNPSLDPDKLTPEFLRSLITLPDRSKIDDFKLPNGLRVITMPHGDAPVIKATMIVEGGTVHDEWGLAEAVDRFYTVDQIDPLQIAGQFGGGLGDTHETLSIKASAGNLDGAMWMLRERIDTRVPYMNGKGSFLKGIRGAIKGQWRSASWHERDLRWGHVNPGHPIHDSWEWSDLDKLKKINPKVIGAELARKWRPDNATLVLVGRLDPREARRFAIKYFGGWRAEGPAEPYPEIPGPKEVEGRQIYVFDDPGKTQTNVTLVCPLAPATSGRSPAHEMLGDIARMTLFAKLREEAGVVYSPFAGAFDFPGGSAYMYMTAAIQNDSATFGMEQYIDYLEEASAGNIDETDLRIKKLSRASGFVLGQQSVDQMSRRLSSVVQNGETWADLEVYADALAAVTVDDLAEITKGCAERAVVTFKGPEDKVTAQLDEAGYEYEVIDPKERGKELHEAADPKDFARDERKRQKAEARKAKKKAKEDAESDDEGDEDAEEGDDESSEESGDSEFVLR